MSAHNPSLCLKISQAGWDQQHITSVSREQFSFMWMRWGGGGKGSPANTKIGAVWSNSFQGSWIWCSKFSTPLTLFKPAYNTCSFPVIMASILHKCCEGLYFRQQRLIIQDHHFPIQGWLHLSGLITGLQTRASTPLSAFLNYVQKYRQNRTSRYLSSINCGTICLCLTS